MSINRKCESDGCQAQSLYKVRLNTGETKRYCRACSRILADDIKLKERIEWPEIQEGKMNMTTLETSREAKGKREASGQDINDRQRIYEHLKNNGGRTCDECEKELGIIHASCSATITGLKNDGIVNHSKLKRKTRTKCNAFVVVLTGKPL